MNQTMYNVLIQAQNNCSPPQQTELRSQQSYVDYANVSRSRIDLIAAGIDQGLAKRKGPRGGVAVPFPCKVHMMLNDCENNGLSHIVSWQPHGRCFVVHKPKEFVSQVMPHYFNQTKMTSFQRQLNLYGFYRLTIGRDRGGYYHPMFLRGREFLAKRILRTRVKGNGGVRALVDLETEPNFYRMTYVTRDSGTSEGPATKALTSLLQNLPQPQQTSSTPPPTSTPFNKYDSLADVMKILDENDSTPPPANGKSAMSSEGNGFGKRLESLVSLSAMEFDPLPLMKATATSSDTRSETNNTPFGDSVIEPTPITSMSSDMPRLPSSFFHFMSYPSQKTLQALSA